MAAWDSLMKAEKAFKLNQQKDWSKILDISKTASYSFFCAVKYLHLTWIRSMLSTLAKMSLIRLILFAPTSRITTELLSPVQGKLRLIDLKSEPTVGDVGGSSLGKRKLEPTWAVASSSISPAKLAKQFIDVDIKKK